MNSNRSKKKESFHPTTNLKSGKFESTIVDRRLSIEKNINTPLGRIAAASNSNSCTLYKNSHLKHGRMKKNHQIYTTIEAQRNVE